jgi:hypothetical protein
MLRNKAKMNPTAKKPDSLLNLMIRFSHSQAYCELLVSKRCKVGLACANAHGALNAEHKDLPVPDLTGFCGRSDCVDGSVDQVARYGHLDLDLGRKLTAYSAPR